MSSIKSIGHQLDDNLMVVQRTIKYDTRCIVLQLNNNIHFKFNCIIIHLVSHRLISLIYIYIK